MSDVDKYEHIVTVDLAMGSKRLEELDAVRKTVKHKRGCSVTLDFSKIDVLASEGIMRLLDLRELIEKRKGHLILSGVSQPTKDVFTLTGLDNIFEFSSDNTAVQTCAPS